MILDKLTLSPFFEGKHELASSIQKTCPLPPRPIPISQTSMHSKTQTSLARPLNIHTRSASSAFPVLGPSLFTSAAAPLLAHKMLILHSYLPLRNLQVAPPRPLLTSELSHGSSQSPHTQCSQPRRGRSLNMLRTLNCKGVANIFYS